LREERAEKQRDMERRRIRIEQTEKKVCLQLLSNLEIFTDDYRWPILRKTSRARSKAPMTST
jgi:kinetochore protein Nuf2